MVVGLGDLSNDRSLGICLGRRKEVLKMGVVGWVFFLVAWAVYCALGVQDQSGNEHGEDQDHAAAIVHQLTGK